MKETDDSRYLERNEEKGKESEEIKIIFGFIGVATCALTFLECMQHLLIF